MELGACRGVAIQASSGHREGGVLSKAALGRECASGLDVSVIIPTYNRLWALPEAIASCRQNDCKTEIIVIDDGSTDGTWEWLQKQADVISVRTDNWGKCWAVNAGIALAQGEFVRFLDSDDWLLPHANDIQLALAREKNADIAVGGYVSCFTSENIKITVPHTVNDDLITDFVEKIGLGTQFSYCASIIRRTVLNDIPHRPEYIFHDYMLILEVLAKEPVVAQCELEVLAVRQHATDRRLTDFDGFALVTQAYGSVEMYRKVLQLLEQRSILTPARELALLGGIWIEARKLAHWDVGQAWSLAKWVHQTRPDFVPPVRPGVRMLYHMVGFSHAERIAKVYRTVMKWIKLARQPDG